jgi:hypothetical protein
VRFELRVVAQVCALAVATIASSQDPNLFGPNRFPQFRDMGGLSGSGFGVNSSGLVSTTGVVSLSTPIGFALGGYNLVVGGAGRSQNASFQWVNTGKTQTNQKSDGTAQFIYGFDTNYGRIAISHMLLSSQLDSVQNLQWQLPIGNEFFGVSSGVHNITRRPHAAVDSLPIADSKNSRSYFLAGTYQTEQGHSITLGKGDTRYRGLFGSFNYQQSEAIRFFGEYDTFNWNYGVTWGQQAGQGQHFFVTLASVAGKYSTWTLNYAF